MTRDDWTKVAIFLAIVLTSGYLIWGKRGLTAVLPFPTPKGIEP